MSQKEIQESLDLMEKDWDFDPILHDFVLGKYTDVTDFHTKSKRCNISHSISSKRKEVHLMEMLLA